jgi:RNA polymerase sigma-70 factor (ECF subfamily)
MRKRVNLTKLAEKARSSQQAVNLLFDAIYPIIWHYFRVRLNSEEDAQDLTQNACIKIVQNLERYDSRKAAFTTWMYRIIHNLLVDFFKKKQLPLSDMDYNILEGTESPVDSVLLSEERERIKEAMENIGDRQREILEMRYFFQMKNKEIAAALEIKEKTVSSLINRALQKLQLLLTEGSTA